MEKALALRNVRLYRYYRTFDEPLMWGPILITSLMHLGNMPLEEIYFMESVVVLGFIFLEVPSGALADIIGRKYTVVIGSFFHLLSIVWFSLVNSSFDVWSANIAWMIGASLRSGADTALLYDSLKEVDKEHDYSRIEGEAIGNRLLLIAIFSLLAGPLAEVNLRLPLLLSIPGIILSTLVTLAFYEPPSVISYSAQAQVNLAKTSILFVANNRAVKWIVGFAVLIGVISKIWFFTYNPYFEIVDLDLKYYGVMFFLLNIVAWVSSRYAWWIQLRLGEEKAFALMVLLLALPIFIMGSILAVASVSMILVQNVVRGLTQPLFGGFLNRHLDSPKRATVNSIKSAVRGLAEAVGLSVFGLILVVWPLVFCLQLLGIATFVLGTYAIWRYRKLFS